MAPEIPFLNFFSALPRDPALIPLARELLVTGAEIDKTTRTLRAALTGPALEGRSLARLEQSVAAAYRMQRVEFQLSQAVAAPPAAPPADAPPPAPAPAP